MYAFPGHWQNDTHLQPSASSRCNQHQICSPLAELRETFGATFFGIGKSWIQIRGAQCLSSLKAIILIFAGAYSSSSAQSFKRPYARSLNTVTPATYDLDRRHLQQGLPHNTLAGQIQLAQGFHGRYPDDAFANHLVAALLGQTRDKIKAIPFAQRAVQRSNFALDYVVLLFRLYIDFRFHEQIAHYLRPCLHFLKIQPNSKCCWESITWISGNSRNVSGTCALRSSSSTASRIGGKRVGCYLCVQELQPKEQSKGITRQFQSPTCNATASPVGAGRVGELR